MAEVVLRRGIANFRLFCDVLASLVLRQIGLASFERFNFARSRVTASD